MSLSRAEKQVVAQKVSEKFKKASLAVFVDFLGLKANEINTLRKMVREKGGEVQVVKNSVIALSGEGDGFSEEVKTYFKKLVGPHMIAFAYQDSATVAKVLKTFSKEHEALTFKDSLLEMRKITSEQVEQLAALPSRKELLAQVLSCLQGPMRGLVGVFAAVPRSFVIVLSEIQKKKEKEN